MILVDANLLLYAYDASSEHHEAARDWLEAVLSGTAPVLLPWPTVLAFLRIGTNSRAFREPLSIAEAVEIVSEWLARPNVQVPLPSHKHWERLKALLPAAQAKADLVMDAHLAVLALERGATLATHDRDFIRFPDLRLEDPLTTR